MLFYLPRIFWTSMEEGKLTAMICGVKSAEKKEETENDNAADILRELFESLMENAPALAATGMNQPFKNL